MLKFSRIASKSLLALLLAFPVFAKAQHHISKYEKQWALIHPLAALKIKKKLPAAMKVYAEVKRVKLLDTLESGGKLDAFRHVYTMAYLSKFVKTSKLRKLGKAHEKGDKLLFLEGNYEFGERPDSLACEMDLRNNELGFAIGSENRHIIDEALKRLVIKAIKDGKAWYLKRNASCHYVDCEGGAIDLAEYKGKWSVPKCLISTDK